MSKIITAHRFELASMQGLLTWREAAALALAMTTEIADDSTSSSSSSSSSSSVVGVGAPFVCADRALCTAAAQLGLVAFERWTPSLLVGYRALLIDAQCLERSDNVPVPRVVLERTTSRRHRVDAGVLRAPATLRVTQRRQVVIDVLLIFFL